MATAVDRRAGARRRRPSPWLVIAPLALGLVVLAVLHPQPSPVPAHADPADWRGTTSQRLAVGATIDGRWLDGLRVHLRLRCDRGARPETFVWTPPPDLFAQDADQLVAHEALRQLPATGGWHRAFDGRLRMVVGDRPHGTASATLRWTRGATEVLCRSGPVAFSLRRGAT
jgi:hypothetical protein